MDNNYHSRSSMMPVVGGDKGPDPCTVEQDSPIVTLPYCGKSAKAVRERGERECEANQMEGLKQATCSEVFT